MGWRGTKEAAVLRFVSRTVQQQLLRGVPGRVQLARQAPEPLRKLY